MAHFAYFILCACLMKLTQHTDASGGALSIKKFMGTSDTYTVTILSDKNSTCKIDKVRSVNQFSIQFDRIYNLTNPEDYKLRGDLENEDASSMKVHKEGEEKTYMETDILQELSGNGSCGIFYTLIYPPKNLTGSFKACELRVRLQEGEEIKPEDWKKCNEIFRRHCHDTTHPQCFLGEVAKALFPVLASFSQNHI